jgi:hypothetical protein
MTVRRATVDDIPALMEMAREEHARSRMAHLPFDDTKAWHSFKEFIEGMPTAVFVSDGGFIMGVVQPVLFNRFWNAYEMAWYSKDGSGIALLNAFAKWAKAMRAIDLIIHNYAGIAPTEQFTKVMGRYGFTPIGGAYTKQLGEI